MDKNPRGADMGFFFGLVIVPKGRKGLQLQKFLKIFFSESGNLVDEFRLFCYNSSLRGYGRESLAAQTHGGALAMEELSRSKKVVGIKQVRKALREGRVQKIWLADDADPALTEPLETACRDNGIEVLRVVTMKELGRACSISVGAACAAEVS